MDCLNRGIGVANGSPCRSCTSIRETGFAAAAQSSRLRAEAESRPHAERTRGSSIPSTQNGGRHPLHGLPLSGLSLRRAPLHRAHSACPVVSAPSDSTVGLVAARCAARCRRGSIRWMPVRRDDRVARAFAAPPERFASTHQLGARRGVTRRVRVGAGRPSPSPSCELRAASCELRTANCELRTASIESPPLSPARPRPRSPRRRRVQRTGRR